MRDGTLASWRVADGTLERSAHGASLVKHLYATPDGRSLWVSSWMHGVFKVDPETLAVKQTYPDDWGVAVSRSPGADGAYAVVRWKQDLALYGQSRSHLFLERWKDNAVLSSHAVVFGKEIRSAAVGADGQVGVAGTVDGLSCVFDAKGQVTASYSGHAGPVEGVDIDPGGTNFLSRTDFEHVVLIRSVKTGALVRKFDLDRGNAADALLISSDEALIADINKDGLEFVHLSEKPKKFEEVGSPIRAALVTGDRRQILTSSDDSVHLWAAKGSGQDLQFQIRGNNRVVAVDGTGTKLYTSRDLPYDYSDALEVRALDTGKLLTRFLHTNTVTAAAYSPDRKQLATGQVGGKITVFDAKTAAVLHTLPGHPGAITSIAFGPNGTLLTEGDDHTARMWDVETEAELWREDAWNSMGEAFSPSGRLMVSWSGGALRILDVERHAVLAELPDIGNYAFTSDERLLGADVNGGTLKLWTRGRKEVSVIGRIPDPEVARIYAVGDSRALVCAGGGAKVFGLESRTELKTFDRADCSAGGVPYILVPAKEMLEVWDVSLMRLVRRLPVNNPDSVKAFEVSADHRYLMVERERFRSGVWDLTAGRHVRDVSFSYDGTYKYQSSLPRFDGGKDRYLTSADAEGMPKVVIEVRTSNAPTRRFATLPFALDSMTLSPDGASLLTCSGDSALRLYDTHSGKLQRALADACVDAAFSPDGKLVVASETKGNNRPRLWTRDLKSEIAAPDYVPSGVKYAAVSLDGSRLATVEARDALRLWDLEKGRELPFPGVAPTDASIRGIELLQGGGLAVIAYSDGAIRTLDLMSGRPFVDSPAAGTIRSMYRAGVNDQIYATLYEDGSLRVWALGMFNPRQTFPAPASAVTAVSLSDDGRLVLIATAGGSIGVGDAATGQLTDTIRSPCTATAVAINPQKTVASMICTDGILRTYQLTTRTWMPEMDTKQTTTVERLQMLAGYTAVISKTEFTVMMAKGELLHPFAERKPSAQGLLFIDRDAQVKALRAGSTVDVIPVGGLFATPSALFHEFVTSVAASPDGHTLALAYSSGWVRFWDMQTGQWGRKNLIGGTSITKLTYSASGKHLLLIKDDRTAVDFNVAMNDAWIAYPSSADIVKADFAGRNDQLVVVAAGKQVRLFDSSNGNPIVSSVLGSDGSSWVVDPDGRYETHPATRTSGSGAPARSPASVKWVDALNRTFPPGPGTAAAALVPPGRELTFEGTEVAENESRPVDLMTAAPTDGALRSVIEVVGASLGFGDKLKVDAGLKIETSQSGDIQMGSALLERALQGQSYASALGFIAFVLGHEHQHSLQSRTNIFETLSDEEHRMLECEADVLGTTEALKFVTLLAGSPESYDALSAVKNAQAKISLMSTIEGSDQAHPTQDQRSAAVDFGVARYFSRFDHDELRALQYARQYQTDGQAGDDDHWTESVCRRILHYRADDQGGLSVAKENERKNGESWEADLRYKNSSNQPIHVSHHVRLVGAAYPLLAAAPRPGLANIDGVLNDFILEAGGERIIKVSLTPIDPVGLHFEPSTIVYSNLTSENWMSVEAVAGPAPSVTKVETPGAVTTPASGGRFCSEMDTPAFLTERQQELGELLYRASADAGSRFQTFRQGSTTQPEFGLDIGTGTKAVLSLSFSSSGSVYDGTDGRSALIVDLGKSQPSNAAKSVFAGMVDDLKALCPSIAVVSTVRDGPTLKFSSATMKNFSSGVDLEVTMLESKRDLPAQVELVVQQQGEKPQ